MSQVLPTEDLSTWDIAYENMAHIKDGHLFPDLWVQNARAYRCELEANSRARCDLKYGDHPRQIYDLLYPKTNHPKGLFIFIHGGYWHAQDKNSWAHYAKHANDEGFICAIMSYRLAPEVLIAEMINDISNLINMLHAELGLKMIIAGHSAGGHLTAMLSLKNNGLSVQAHNAIVKTIAISAIADLKPITLTKMNKILKINDYDLTYINPVDNYPRTDIPIISIVGQNERPEFLRQSALLTSNWKSKGAQISERVIENRHHFDIVEVLLEPNEKLFEI